MNTILRPDPVKTNRISESHPHESDLHESHPNLSTRSTRTTAKAATSVKHRSSPAGDICHRTDTTISNRAYVYRSSRDNVPKDVINVVIDSSVTTISRGAFSRQSRLVSVDFSESITHIDDVAFEGCKRLSSLTLPNSLTYIGTKAFKNCKNLTSIRMSESPTDGSNEAFLTKSFTEICSSAFEGCTSLKSIHLPDTCTYILHEAFYNCNSIASIHLPDSITHIGSRVFQCCTGLKWINLPSCLATIHADTFYGCTNLSSIVVPPSLSNIDIFRNFSTTLRNGRTINNTLGTLSKVLNVAGLFPFPYLYPDQQVATTFMNARIKDRHGRWFLCTAVEAAATKGTWEGEGGLGEIFTANMAAVDDTDVVTGLEPFMLAGMGPNSSLEVIYHLLRENPPAITRSGTRENN